MERWMLHAPSTPLLPASGAVGDEVLCAGLTALGGQEVAESLTESLGRTIVRMSRRPPLERLRASDLARNGTSRQAPAPTTAGASLLCFVTLAVTLARLP